MTLYAVIAMRCKHTHITSFTRLIYWYCKVHTFKDIAIATYIACQTLMYMCVRALAQSQNINFMYKTYNTLIVHTEHDHMLFLVTACYTFNVMRASDSFKDNKLIKHSKRNIKIDRSDFIVQLHLELLGNLPR